MSELNEMWSQMLSQALENAKASGRGDVVEYLSLKAANDAIRQTGLRWLFDTLLEISGETNRAVSGISIERTDPHNFSYRAANLVGSSIRLKHGVRCLTVEAGWTRTPSDGFMRGGALAFARLIHRGIPEADAELSLVMADAAPAWKVIRNEKPAETWRSEHLRSHLQILTGK